MAKIMAVNAGSSSLKFQLIEMPSEKVISSGIVERIGQNEGNFEIVVDNKKHQITQEIPDHKAGVEMLLKALIDYSAVASLSDIAACGHRVVQGGDFFKDSAICTDENVAVVESLIELAPLHNGANLVGYRSFKEALGVDSKHVFVFDTAFHQTLDPERYLYALPYEYYENYKIRKYGAHGTSHQYVSQEIIKHMGSPKKSRIIVCHLGNGASISAVQDGVCIDTSMGFTPLAGLMMGTRCGDIDPSIIPFMCKKLNKSPDEFLDIMNKESGMLGVSGISSDSRDIENALFKKGDERALMTGLLYSRIVSKYIGSYVMELGGVDVIAFTAGVGENASYLRRIIIDNVSRALGAHLDEKLNEIRSKEIRTISTPNSQVEVMVVPTNEEIMIARDVCRIYEIR